MLCWFTSRKKAWVGFSCKRRLWGQGQESLGQPLWGRHWDSKVHLPQQCCSYARRAGTCSHRLRTRCLSPAELLGAPGPPEPALGKASFSKPKAEGPLPSELKDKRRGLESPSSAHGAS